ncbi:MAG: RidA family protein [Candidatus Eisenbacteria bacterium]|nr:RidA family protein [Candidatus Eisenbacteria bacterium]
MTEPVKSNSAPAPVGPYSQAILARPRETLYSAGQIPIDAATGTIPPGGIKEQTRRVMENLKEVLAAAGYDFKDVVKTTVFMVDLGEFGSMNEVYGEYLSEPFPARSTVQVGALPKGARVEIEVVAVKEAG